MDLSRWEQLEDLLQHALDLAPAERASFLDQNCGGSQTLRFEIEALLSKETDARRFLETPAVVCFEEQISISSPAPLSRISHYNIEEQIGGGGMGEVYKAHDETLRRVVALKMLPPQFTSDHERVQRLEQEALAASRLNHPNIVTIFEITNANGTPFIAEEFVEGQTLDQLLTHPQTKAPAKLHLKKTLDIAIQITDALKAAHTAWIIHRDIKPENIMVRSDGLVKVLDFGIAKLVEPEFEPRPSDPERVAPYVQAETSKPNLTVPGCIMGTASYMSPEQARGDQLDGRTDLFSLGLLLYEMATGQRLLAGTTRADVLRAIEDIDKLLLASIKFGQIPKELQRIIRRALRHNRDERYASASELQEDLKRLNRRLESTSARRIVTVSALTVLAVITLAVVTAFLSINETWQETILRDGHSAATRRAVFSPDGRLLVSVSEDHQVIVWDFLRRERLKTLTDHTAVVNTVAFSPDGKWFVTGSDDQTLILWDAGLLEKEKVIREQLGPVRSATFSPDGRLLVSTSGQTAIVREFGSWKTIREVPWDIPYGNHVFLRNNRWLAENSGRIWDLSTGEVVQDSNVDWQGNWVDTSPDGTRWVGIDYKGDVKVVDLVRRKSIAVKHVHHDHGRSIAFSPDGKLLATAAERIILWDAVNFVKSVPLEYKSVVWSVVFSPDGRWLVSTHGDGAILVWDITERELAANLRGHSGGVRAVAFSPDGKRFATASEDKSVIVWDGESGQKQAVLTGHQTRVASVTFSRDGHWLASIDHDGVVIRWDVGQRVPQSILRPPRWRPGYCLAISSDGRYVATSEAVYEVESGRQVVVTDNDQWLQVYSAAFTDDARLIGVTDRAEILVLDTRTWQLTERHAWSDTPLVSLSLSPDGKHLVTGDDGKTIRLGTTTPIRQLGLIGEHEARIKAVAFSADGKQVASASDDKTIRLWDVNRRKLIASIGTHTSPVYSVVFSPKGQRLISGEQDGSVRLYTRQRTLWGFSLE